VGEGFGVSEHRSPHALTSRVGANVDTLELCAPTRGVLEVAKDDHLTHPHDNAVVQRDQ
jgi:hypothetical protein